jgi:hypothetical protein
LTSAYGTVTVPGSVGSGTGAQSAVADIGGLTVATTYHFRVVASNEFGTTYGPDQSLTTVSPPTPPPPTETKPPKKCKKGFVKKNGKCVKKKTKKKSSKRHG